MLNWVYAKMGKFQIVRNNTINRGIFEQNIKLCLQRLCTYIYMHAQNGIMNMYEATIN